MTKTDIEALMVWVVSLDSDSFNYFPVKHPKEKVLEHNKKCPSDEIVDWYYTEEECQEQCDRINSL